MKFFAGLDLGQARDYTAIAILERTSPPAAPDAPPAAYQCGYLYRFPLGTMYSAIATRMVAMMETPELKSKAELVVDYTGPGIPVVDSFRAAGLRPVPVTIHGGSATNHAAGSWRVAKRDLVGVTQVLL